MAEMVCPVWNSGLTCQEIRSIKIIQRTAMTIIREENHTALTYLNLKSLEERRKNICLKLPLRAHRHPQFSLWFTKNVNTVYTIRTKTPLVKKKRADQKI